MCFAPAFGDEEGSMGKINERCGGIDVGKRFLLCCVLTGAAHEEPRSQTRRFDATVSDLVRLREWLVAERVMHVVMEHWLLLGSSVQHPGRSFHCRAGQPRGGKEPQGPQDGSQGCRTSGRPPATRSYPRQLHPAQAHSRPAGSNSPTTAIDTRWGGREPGRKTSGTRERQNWKCS